MTTPPPAPLSVEDYNYDAFVEEKFSKLSLFDQSPAAGERGPDYAIWDRRSGDSTSLSDLWRGHELLIVEFGSFT